MADGTAGGRGITYETRLCMLLACRGYMKGLENFRLRYQVPESKAGKFDDVVFDEGGGNYQIFQLKHKENAGQIKMSGSQLFSENLKTDYNLLKYVKSVIDINSNNCLGGEMRRAVVFTNIDFDFQKDSNQLSLISNRKDWYKEFTEIQLNSFDPEENAIFSFPDAKYYKFDKDPNIVQILKRQSETVSKELRKKLERQKNTKTEKFESQENKLKENDEALAKTLGDLTEDIIQDALKYIVYAVRQPNDKELEKIIKNEIKGYFKLQNVDPVYALFENAMAKWCNTKDPFDDQRSSPNSHVIQFKDAEVFFQNNVKKVSFGDNTPTSCFAGRLAELVLIKKKLEENSDLIVSQSVKISGLGGIGKTELVKQFIKEFGQSNFYRRVIWIEAESDESVKKSFKGLAEKIDIQDRENKSITSIIDQIFDYFHGVKVLFVFDNFDKNAETNSNDDEKHLVIYCQKRACDPTKKHWPYFIFTSRNRKCLPGMSSLDLGVLREEDPIEFIKKGLNAKNFMNQDVEELAKTLQYFPLALQQAIAYINRKHEIESVSGGGYVIQDYLIEIVEKTKDLLNYPHINDFGEYGQTTWVTWNVTFDAISKETTNGLDAIELLHHISYLYADKIDSKMFLLLFENDSKRNGEAFLLLEKYSFITRIGEGTFYQIHRLVQATVQLKFTKRERNTLIQTWVLIYPELYESYFIKNKNWHQALEVKGQCTIDQILHYNNLATYIKNYEDLNTEFVKFLRALHDKVFWVASMQDEIDKIKTLQFPPQALNSQFFLKEYISLIIIKRSNRVFKYLVENGYFELNDPKIIRGTIWYGNFELLKYMIEKGSDLKNLNLLSKDIMYDIIQGKASSLLHYIEHEKTEEENEGILHEALFFASLFNQENMVELLISNKISPRWFASVYKWYDTKDAHWHMCPILRMFFPSIIAAAELKYPRVVEILLKHFDLPTSDVKFDVSVILIYFCEKKYITDKDCFEIAFKKYLELGGDVNDRNRYEKQSTFLTLVTEPRNLTVEKMEIVNFLLDNGADPCLLNTEGNNAMFNVIFTMNSLSVSEDKGPFYDIYYKMYSKITLEQFMFSIVERLYTKVQCEETSKISDDLFKYILDINFRNKKGETFLISFVHTFKISYKSSTINEKLVNYLIEAGIDVEAKDNDDKNALFYALNLESPEIFTFLLNKFSSVSEEILIKAIKDDKSHCVEELLKTHFELDHTFEDGKTFLEVAFENLSLDTILLLHPKIKELKLETGECEKINRMAQMALILFIKTCSQNDWFVNNNYLETFIEITSDVNAIDEDGNNALHYAADLTDVETFGYFLSKGSKVLEKTLKHVIEKDKLEIVKAIIPKYFEIDHCFTNGSSAIKLANKFKAKKVKIFLTELSPRKRNCSMTLLRLFSC